MKEQGGEVVRLQERGVDFYRLCWDIFGKFEKTSMIFPIILKK